MRSKWWSLLICINLLGVSSERVCIFYQDRSLKNLDTSGSDPSLPVIETRPDGVVIQRCKYNNNYCYALWKLPGDTPATNDTSLISYFAQGCWQDSPQSQACSQSECVTRSAPRVSKSPLQPEYTKFCCCQGNYCNSNISDLYVPNKIPYDDGDVPVISNDITVADVTVVVVPIVFSVLLVLFIGFLMRRCWPGKKKGSGKNRGLFSSMRSSERSEICTSLIHDLSSLDMRCIVGRGRYGNVWAGNLYDKTVAVKVFPSQYKHYFVNEKDIYTLPHMQHPNILTYYGFESKLSSSSEMEYYLVLAYMSQGCLQDYLKKDVLDWKLMCRMLLDIAKGLAHLHTDITAGDHVKPAICHRDLSSRNVLVGCDFTCVICDYGFALQMHSTGYYQNGEKKSDTTSLTDVGTLRYMAPEVLEGSVNLRDCENALKQIDVYALGLIIWEIASRCTDLYSGNNPPDYQPPFDAETGGNICFEEMLSKVSRGYVRPALPPVKQNNQAIRLLYQTIEECWDKDPEARLTALCVRQRFLELPSLWEQPKVPSSTVNELSLDLSHTTVNIPVGENSDDTLDTTVTNLSPQEISGGNLISPQRSS